MKRSALSISKIVVPALLILCGCTSGPQYNALDGSPADTPTQAHEHRIAEIVGLDGPEAVRYDDQEDAYYIANFAGSGRERDENGFITRVDIASGSVTERFAIGQAFPLHAPRGMYINGDTLWVADIDGIHGFDKRSGSQLTFIDLSGFEPSFLNDVSRGADGTLYVSDTGGRRVLAISGDSIFVAVEDFGNPNGITHDPESGSMLIAPWDEGDPILGWLSGTDSLYSAATMTSSKIDGIEPLDGGILFAAQSDSSIQLAADSVVYVLIKTGGKPADIGVDTKRQHVAVPYIALDRVDIWQLPE